MSYEVIIKPKGNPEFEDEPVYWCKQCKSLAIITTRINHELSDFTSRKCICKDCGSNKVVIGSMDEWIDEIELEKKNKEEKRREIRREQSEINKLKREIICQESARLKSIKNKRKDMSIDLSDTIEKGLKKWI